MIWSTAAKVAVSALDEKYDLKGKIAIILMGLILFPVLVVMCFFGGDSDAAEEPYQKAFKELGCGDEYAYQLDDIRLLEAYILEAKETDEEPKYEDIKERMENDYFHISSSSNVCLLYSDEELVDMLIKKYHVSKSYKQEIMDALKQIRNGRENFSYPIKGTILSRYSEEQPGIVMHRETQKEKITASASGKVVSVSSSNDSYKYGDDISVKEGLTIKIEHQIRRSVDKESGEYDDTTMYSIYTNVKNIKVAAGDEVMQGDELGMMAEDTMYFQLIEKKKYVDPSKYIYDPGTELGDYANVLNPEVLRYSEYIQKYMKEIGMRDEFLNVVLCVIQIESGGKGTDPMQSSECPENTRYPNKPNGIMDPFYSIQCGVRYLKKCMEEAGVKNKDDIKKLQLAAQGYNFGNGYISWAKLRGGYSYENALEFSRMQADSHGWNSYGDPMYGLKFYNVYTSTSSADAGNLKFIYPMKDHMMISAGYGPYDPFGTGSTMHWGVDFPAPAGTPYTACEAGIVTYVGYNEAGGLMIMIQHNATYTTLYDHSSKLKVKVGQHVKKGEVIGYVGTTGNVTGPHVHLELRKTVDGVTQRIDILPYLNRP